MVVSGRQAGIMFDMDCCTSLGALVYPYSGMHVKRLGYVASRAATFTRLGLVCYGGMCGYGCCFR